MGLGFYDAMGQTYFFMLPHIKPVAGAREEENVIWEQTARQQSSFTAEVVREKSEKKIVYVWKKEKTAKLVDIKLEPNPAELPVMYRTFCYAEIHVANEQLMNWCQEFARGFHLHDDL
jgi:hypothetical protein